jgi:hypothetical protein
MIRTFSILAFNALKVELGPNRSLKRLLSSSAGPCSISRIKLQKWLIDTIASAVE